MISVIIPVYNLERFVVEALESIRAQTCDGWEALVIDDCSTDRTFSVIQAYLDVHSDPRFRLIRMQSNSGVSAARNEGVSESRGDWLAFLDGDDCYEPSFLEEMINGAQRSGAGVVHCRAKQCDEFGRTIGGYGPYWFDRIRAPRGLFTRNYILPGMMICSRKVWEDIGGFDEEPRIQHVEDWDWVLRALEAGVRFYYQPTALVRWRRHPESATHQQYRQWRRARYLIRKHAELPLFRPHVRAARITIFRNLAYRYIASNPARACALYGRSIKLQPSYLPAYVRWLQANLALARHRKRFKNGESP